MTIKIRYYACGYCTNDLHWIFKHNKHEKRNFPSGVFLIQHPNRGNILFDTGYSTNIYDCGLIGRLYNKLNPTFVKPEDEIKWQLKNDGISINEIDYIILSHLHPDHIGGAKDFPNAQIIVSQAMSESYNARKLFDLILPTLLPTNFTERARIIRFDNNHREFDLFKDKSIILKQMNGHANGQLTALVDGKTLLAADTCWGSDLFENAPNMSRLTRKIQYNFTEYLADIDEIKRLRSDGIKVYFSHDLEVNLD